MSGGLGDVSLSPSCSHELGLYHMLHHKEFGNMQHMMGRLVSHRSTDQLFHTSR